MAKEKKTHLPDECPVCSRIVEDPNEKDCLKRIHHGDLATFWPGTRLSRMDSMRFCAQELEVSSAKDSAYRRGTSHVRTLMKKWESTVGGDAIGTGGFELCTAPASGDQFVRQAMETELAFYRDNVFVTKGCGGHTHVDIRDHCYSDVRRLVLLYWALEPAIFALAPDYRQSSKWCGRVKGLLASKLLGAKDPGECKDALLEYFFRAKNKISTRSKLTPAGSRYYGMNLMSYFCRGTVEFRMPPGMVKSTEMIGWARVLAKLVDSAYTRSNLEVARLIDTDSVSPSDEYGAGASKKLLLGLIATTDRTRTWCEKHFCGGAEKLWTETNGKRVESIGVSAGVLTLEREV